MTIYPNNTRNITFNEINTNYPIYNKVIPQQSDYENGFFYRYFVKKANDKMIYEISRDNYIDVSPDIYIRIAINWKLTGKKNDIYQNKIKIEEGVYEYNKNQINIHKKYMPGIENTLRNPLEYWKPS
jgi:hypothetical protein